MAPGKLLRFPMRRPEMFTPEINREALIAGGLNRFLYAAIRALPYVQDPRRREELKRALCELLQEGDAA